MRLHLLSEDDDLARAVTALAPTEEQEPFSSRAAVTLPEALADPDRHPFAVLAGDDPVGFGVLDRRGYLADVVDSPERAVLLRGFYLDAGAQGRGWGTQAARLVPALAADLPTDTHPRPELAVLTVNVRNERALASYLRAGWVDTERRYLGGDLGPQHLLVARVPRAVRLA
ncbi:GNAT family N-acetyltransferase [Thalassiella azotivora]